MDKIGWDVGCERFLDSREGTEFMEWCHSQPARMAALSATMWHLGVLTLPDKEQAYLRGWRELRRLIAERPRFVVGLVDALQDSPVIAEYISDACPYLSFERIAESNAPCPGSEKVSMGRWETRTTDDLNFLRDMGIEA